jgi:DNA (cytosine-5)-methyltransferase 1
MSIKIGSLFSGIGSFELGLERSIPNSETVWQVEQDKFCQSILEKHWPSAQKHNDVNKVGAHNLEPVDIICGGFPCQDISIAGDQRGIYAERSGLWWEMQRIISELRPRVVVVENVPALYVLGMREVLGSMASIGYDAEWTTISAAQCGAPHVRKRVFIVCYPSTSSNKRWTFTNTNNINTSNSIQTRRSSSIAYGIEDATNTNSTSFEKQSGNSISLETARRFERRNSKTNGNDKRNYWEKVSPPSALCRVDDGITRRVAKLKALGNSIVPQCSEWIGHQIMKANLL